MSLEEKLSSWLTNNEEVTRQGCKALLSDLKRRHLDPVFEQLLGKEAVKVSFEDIIGGYQRIKDDYHKSAIGAEDVIAIVFVELHKVRSYQILIEFFLNFDSMFYYNLRILCCPHKNKFSLYNLE